METVSVLLSCRDVSCVGMAITVRGGEIVYWHSAFTVGQQSMRMTSRIWLRCVDWHAVSGTGFLAIRFFLQRIPPASGRIGVYTHIVVVVRGP